MGLLALIAAIVIGIVGGIGAYTALRHSPFDERTHLPLAICVGALAGLGLHAEPSGVRVVLLPYVAFALAMLTLPLLIWLFKDASNPWSEAITKAVQALRKKGIVKCRNKKTH